MKVILIFVATLDGKITKWGDSQVRAWTSKEDQEYFRNSLQKSKLIVMGSNSFKADRPKLNPDQLFVVLTSNPELYKKHEVKNQLEFSSDSPKIIVNRFKKMNYEQMLLVGGAHVATSFLKDQLIDEIWLTIEPKVFGTGGNFVIQNKLDIDLKLVSCEKINEQGTLITKYIVLKK